jgi:hypothetical protein
MLVHDLRALLQLHRQQQLRACFQLHVFTAGGESSIGVQLSLMPTTPVVSLRSSCAAFPDCVVIAPFTAPSLRSAEPMVPPVSISRVGIGTHSPYRALDGGRIARARWNDFVEDDG